MKTVIWIVVGVIIVLWGVSLGLQWWLEAQIKNTLENEMSQRMEGAVRVEIGDVRVRLIGRSVRLKNIHMEVDSVQPIQMGDFRGYGQAHIRELDARGIHFRKRDSVVQIHVKKLGLEVSLVKWLDRGRGNESFTKEEGKDTLANGLKEKLFKLKVDQLEVGGENINYARVVRDTLDSSLNGLRCKIEGGRMTVASEKKFDYAWDDVKLAFDSLRSEMAGKSQLFEVDSFYLGSKEELIFVNKVSLTPQYSKQEFASRAEGHPDWTQVQTGKIVIRGFDLQRLLSERFIAIDSVKIEGVDISTFKNRQIEQPRQVKLLFYESVQQFPWPLAIERIDLDSVHVEYQELSKQGIVPGTIVFDRISGVFRDLTNVFDPAKPYFTLEAQGELMGQGNIHAVFVLPVDSLNDRFEVKGYLGKMNMMSLNGVIEPLTKIRIVSGTIDTMDFQIVGNSRKATVNMLFLYEGLKIRMQKEKDGQLKTLTFFTNLVNGLLIKEDNPDRKGTRKASGMAERDLYRSQFNYLWRTLLSGLKISIGID